MNHFPKILIILATYNGIRYLPEQINSILHQRNVNLEIVVSDDNSSDDTYQYIQNLALHHSQIKVLPLTPSFGSAGRNFYRLIVDFDLSQYDYVAFADQDDIWLPEKLERHIELIKKHNADGVSSNVLAFWPDGKTKLINKAQAQRKYDYLFESAGPGCTFLVTADLLNKVKDILLDHSDIAQQVALHDWLTYAVCRSSGKKWIIDPVPSVRYRQHSHNVVGANSGIKALWTRLKKITNGWYRQEVIKITEICMLVSTDPNLKVIYQGVTTPGFKGTFFLFKYLGHIRRGLRDRVFLAFSILLGVF